MLTIHNFDFLPRENDVITYGIKGSLIRAKTENQIKIEEIVGYKALTELLPQTRNLFHLFGDPPS